jgi:hypothetical protein
MRVRTSICSTQRALIFFECAVTDIGRLSLGADDGLKIIEKAKCHG